MKKNKEKTIETDPTRPFVLSEIEKYEKLGEFDHHTDPVDYSVVLPVDENFAYIRKDKIRTAFLRKTVVYPFAKKACRDLSVEVKGIENLKNIKSAILTSNHVNKFDCLAIQNTLMPKKTYVIAADFNNVSGRFGEMMRVGGMLPLSKNHHAMGNLLKAVSFYLKRGDFVLVYPEQAMWWNYEKPRPYKDGAFTMALKNSVPVVPIFITFRNSGLFDSNGIEKKYLTLNIMEPIYPKDDLSFRENVNYMREKNMEMCRNKYEEVYKRKL